jgi:Mg2+/citrate symporter
MFVLPIIIFPFVFVLAVFRLYNIPRRLLSGELQVPARHRVWLSVATAAAYLMLLGYTVALSAALVRAIFMAEESLAAYWPLVVYVLGYPVGYLVSAWVFYYGLKPTTHTER